MFWLTLLARTFTLAHVSSLACLLVVRRSSAACVWMLEATLPTATTRAAAAAANTCPGKNACALLVRPCLEPIELPRLLIFVLAVGSSLLCFFLHFPHRFRLFAPARLLTWLRLNCLALPCSRAALRPTRLPAGGCSTRSRALTLTRGCALCSVGNSASVGC